MELILKRNIDEYDMWGAGYRNSPYYLDAIDMSGTYSEPVNMNPERLKAEFGDKLTYCGMLDNQWLLPYGTVEECRAAARHRIKVIGKGGGYIFCSSHNLQIDTPLENILAIYEEVSGKKFM